MSINAQQLSNGRLINIKISGEFDFSLHQAFREAYRHNTETGMQYQIDLSEATYIDSSALGMILLLKEHADKFSGSIVVTKPNEAIDKILKIANFQQLMEIKH